MQNAETVVLNPEFRAQEHRHTKLDSTPTASVRFCQWLQWAQEISPYGNIGVESVSLNILYIHVYLTIHEVGAHLCNYRADELTTRVTKLGLNINLMRDNMFAIYEINIISFQDENILNSWLFPNAFP